MEPTTRKYEYFYSDNSPDHHHAYLISPLLEMLSQAKPFGRQQLRILDLGCGNGSLSHLIAQHGYEVVGVDNSESGIANAKLSFPDCQFIQASIYDMPYSKLANSFDVVISVDVIEHLLYPRELVRAASKCLKPNGRLIVTTPYHGYFKNVMLAISGQMDKHFTALWDGGHVKFFSVATMSALLEAEGHTDINFKFAGRWPYLWKSMLCSSTPIQN